MQTSISAKHKTILATFISCHILKKMCVLLNRIKITFFTQDYGHIGIFPFVLKTFMFNDYTNKIKLNNLTERQFGTGRRLRKGRQDKFNAVILFRSIRLPM